MDTDNERAEIVIARGRRDLALACALLSLAIALATVFSNVGPDHATDEILVLVRQHRDLLAQNQSVLENNQRELGQAQRTLEAILQSRKITHR